MTSRRARRRCMPECIGRVVEVQCLLGFTVGMSACAAELPRSAKLIMFRKAEDGPEEEIAPRAIETMFGKKTQTRKARTSQFRHRNLSMEQMEERRLMAAD
jgi:hypothetical protein